MGKKEDSAFQLWVEELAEGVPQEEKEAFDAWVQTSAARETYRGYLREQEFHRRLNTLEQEKTKLAELRSELENWYEEEAPKNEALLAERDQLRYQLEALGSGGPPPAEGAGISVSPKDLEEIKQKAQKAEVLDKLLPAVLGDISAVLKDSLKNGFDVDPREVIQLSLRQGIEPYRAYEILTQEERQKRYAEAQEAEKKKWFEEGRRAALTGNSPDHLQPSGPSVVDYLQTLNSGKQAESTRDGRLRDALKEFAEGSF